MKEQTMKRTILAAAFLALLGSAGVSWSADFQKGLDAAKIAMSNIFAIGA
jgi:hypothetical protein